jgi:hypothetical protein
MSVYNLKDAINQWTNIEISIDNDNNSITLYVNGEKQTLQPGANTSSSSIDNTLTIINKRLTKDATSKITLGGKSSVDISTPKQHFTGKMERFTITNKTKTPVSAKNTFIALKSRKTDTMIALQFKNNGVSDSSKYKTKKRQVDIETDVLGVVIKTDDNRYAVEFNNNKFIEMDPTSSMSGDNLKNTTFAAWIKTPAGYTNAGYEPIISRNGIFSFGLNNGHSSLFLGKDNQLVPGTNITNEVITSTTLVTSIKNIMEQDNENLIFDANFNTNDTSVKPTSLTKKYSSIIPGSKYIQLSKTEKIELDKKNLIGKDLSSFTFSGWVNFASLNDNGIIFERPDAGLKLIADATGRVSLNYNVIQ